MSRGFVRSAEAAYARILSLPVFPAMSEADADEVIDAVRSLGRDSTSPA